MENNKKDEQGILSEEEMIVDNDTKKKSGLDEDTILEVRRIYKKQKEEKEKDKAGWDFWDERVQIENLLCQRFNYLILCYSLFITAFAVIPDKTSKIILLSVGFIVVFLISLFVKRAWYKLDINLKFLFVIKEKYNGIKLIDDLAKKRGKVTNFLFKVFKIRYNQLIGGIIPFFLCISLLLGILSIALGWWNGGVLNQ